MFSHDDALALSAMASVCGVINNQSAARQRAHVSHDDALTPDPIRSRSNCPSSGANPFDESLRALGLDLKPINAPPPAHTLSTATPHAHLAGAAPSRANVCATRSGMMNVASAVTLTGVASNRILPHETASSGLAPESEPSKSCAVLTKTE